jgi:hypothetical protein
MNRLRGVHGLLAFLLAAAQATAQQVIPFESNGLKYQALTKSGVTVMFALMPLYVHGYAVVQVAVSNGSQGPYAIRPEDFAYTRPDGEQLHAVSPRTVIAMLQQKGSGNDVIKLVTAYEASVAGNPHVKSNSGYEQRRQAAIAMGGSRSRAAATASALAFVQSHLAPGDSTDGAVFFETEGKPMGPGKMVVRTSADVFEFASTS